MPYEQRVEKALQKILASRSWTTPQRQWLQRIANQSKGSQSWIAKRWTTTCCSSSGKGATGLGLTGCSAASWMGCCSISSGRYGRREASRTRVNYKRLLSVVTTIEITLPDALAAEAKAAGLLSAEAMENLVRSKLAAVRVMRLQQAREILKGQPAEPMTVQEINAEIKAYRQGQRLATGS